jgi:excisionase family DNA binding protein
MSPFLTTKEAAERVRLSVASLERMRVRGDGAPFIRMGSRIVYDREALDAWARSRSFNSTSEYAA